MTSLRNHQLVFGAGIATGVVICLVSLSILPNITYTLRMTWIDYTTPQDTSLKYDTVQQLCSNDASVSYHNLVTPNQIDRSQHMNNSNYLYELNFSRRHFCDTLGIWNVLRKYKANMVVQCQTIRYRKELKVWQAYRIQTRILEIDEHEGCFYLESRFLMNDGFVAAIHHVKYKIVGPKAGGTKTRVSPVEVLVDAGVLTRQAREPVVINPNGFIALWEKGNKYSSKELNPK